MFRAHVSGLPAALVISLCAPGSAHAQTPGSPPIEARSHFDLGDERTAARIPGSPPEAAFDLVAGPLVTVALGPVALLAEAGMHALVLDRNGVETESFGAMALVGAGATF